MDKRILTDDDVCEVVREYIAGDLYRHAIMLDGQWGSGKTYFVQNRLTKEFAEHSEEYGKRHLIYVSLFGVSTIDALETATVSAYYLSVSPKRKKAADIAVILAPSILTKVPLFGGALANNWKKGVSQIEKQLFEMEQCFFVFDDLERCQMPVEELFGYMNRLVEHNGCKVMILANEEECMRPLQSSAELRMIAAQLYKEYRPEREHTTLFGGNRTPGKEELLDEMRRFADELFDQSEGYRKAKEKLIGKTIHYCAPLEVVVPSIVRSVFGGRNEKTLQCIIRTSVNSLGAEDCRNMRILQFSIQSFAPVLDIIQDMDTREEIRMDVISCALASMIRVAVRAKMRTSEERINWKLEWESERPFDQVNCLPKESRYFETSELMKSFFSFRFVHHYILSGKLDEEEAKKDLKVYILDQEDKFVDPDGPYERIARGYDYLSEVELKECIEEIERRIADGTYSGCVAIQAIRRVLQYQMVYGLEYCNAEKMMVLLEKRIDSGKTFVNVYNERLMVEEMKPLNGPTLTRYEQFLDRIERLELEKSIEAVREKYNCFEKENWSEVFRTLASEEHNKNELLGMNRFAAILDIPRMIRALNTGNGVDYKNVRDAFRDVYRRDYESFTEDVESLDELIRGIKERAVVDRLLERSRRETCRVLEELLKRIRATAKEEAARGNIEPDSEN